jgi:hypothetical protein
VNSTSMTCSCSYWPRGFDPATGHRWPNRTFTIGTPASHSPDGARAEANSVKGKAKTGGDPVAERKASAATELRNRSGTVERLLEAYERALPNRPKMRGEGLPSAKYVEDEISNLRAAIADLGMAEKPVGDLDIADVRRMQACNGNNRPRFGAMSRFLDWCQGISSS